MVSKVAAGGVLLPLLLVASCGVLTGPGEPHLIVSTSQDMLNLSEEGLAEIPFTIENRGGAPAFVSRCGERIMTALDRREGESWAEYRGDGCPAIYPMVSLEIGPGQSVSSVLVVWEPGVYRIRIGTESSGASDQWTVTSNSFTVRPFGART
jgi:hypothetical protein